MNQKASLTTDTRCQVCERPFSQLVPQAMSGNKRADVCEECARAMSRFYADAESVFED